MKVIIAKNYDELSVEAAKIVANVIKNNPNCVLGLATGTSPIGLYDELVRMYENKEISFKNVKTVNLDEYKGLSGEHDQSYRYFMNKYLFNRIDIDKANTNVPNGLAEDSSKECERYTNLVKELRQDVQVLGLGSNGHIAFNEPGTSFDSHTHIVDLTENTIKDNSRLFKNVDEVPRQAYTMGINDIINAKTIVLVANGANKAKAVKAMVEGEVTTDCPASILKNHPNCTVIVDEPAASLLTK